MQVQGADGVTRDVDSDALVRLTQGAATLAVPDHALDDLVSDCCDAHASDLVNTDSDLVDLDIEDVQDIAYGRGDLIASEVNNEGRDGQLAFLLAVLGYDRALDALRGAVGRR